MALTDIYKLDLVCSSDGEEIRNVFFYRKGPAGFNSQQLNAEWVFNLESKLQAVLCSVISFDRLDTYCLGDPTDFHSEVLGDTGNIVNPPLPMHAALNFTLKLDTRAVRPGSKRFSGISEDATAYNVVTNAPYLIDVETLRNALSDPFGDPPNEKWFPIVVKRIKYAVPGYTPTRYAYRLPETDGELVYGNVITALFNTRVSHQVSRGNGR